MSSPFKTPDALILAVLAAAITVWTAIAYPLLTVAFVVLSLALAASSLWSSITLLGLRTTRIFLAVAAPLGWFAEEMGSTRGWFFGSYSYTEVLGPRLGSVPVVIPFMWFGLCQIGLTLASLLLWRRPAPPAGGLKTMLLAAFGTAMIVTAFDLGADPYFVYQLKAWIMADTNGRWFGETVRGFEGWMLVGFTILMVFQAIAKPVLAEPPAVLARRAALVPIASYAFMMLFQLAVGDPIALRIISFYAMGIPLLAAAAAWSQWRPGPAGAAA